MSGGALRVDIWSDFTCPWCYIGRARFDRALAGFEHADRVTVVNRSFQLDPSRGEPVRVQEMLAAKYGRTAEEAAAMDERPMQLALAEGLPFSPDRLAGNTFDLHRLTHAAAVRQADDALLHAVFRSYFSGDDAVFRRDGLLDLAAASGLPRDEAAGVLDGDLHADAVWADQEMARRLGITGVPFFVLDERLGVSGAQETAVLATALQRAWREREERTGR